MLNFGVVAVLSLVAACVLCISISVCGYVSCCYLYESFIIMYLAAYAMNWLLVLCKMRLCGLLAIIIFMAIIEEWPLQCYRLFLSMGNVWLVIYGGAKFREKS